MTREFQRKAKCPKCGTEIPLEDEFGQWLRDPKTGMPSHAGFVFMDRDLVVHRFKVDHNRGVQCMMFVEIKTNFAELKNSQRDSMLMIDQVMRNRRRTPTKLSLRKQLPFAPVSLFSHAGNQWVRVKLLGYHLLTLSGTTPANSSSIRWDKREVTCTQLISLLKCELDPDHPERPMDLRRHHRKPPDNFLDGFRP